MYMVRWSRGPAQPAVWGCRQSTGNVVNRRVLRVTRWGRAMFTYLYTVSRDVTLRAPLPREWVLGLGPSTFDGRQVFPLTAHASAGHKPNRPAVAPVRCCAPRAFRVPALRGTAPLGSHPALPRSQVRRLPFIRSNRSSAASTPLSPIEARRRQQQPGRARGSRSRPAMGSSISARALAWRTVQPGLDQGFG
jgi:hypothetical protein